LFRHKYVLLSSLALQRKWQHFSLPQSSVYKMPSSIVNPVNCVVSIVPDKDIYASKLVFPK
jgi:hypothetical protein